MLEPLHALALSHEWNYEGADMTEPKLLITISAHFWILAASFQREIALCAALGPQILQQAGG